MKIYYGQMTKEELDGVSFEPDNKEHSRAFQEMCFNAGVGWPGFDVKHTEAVALCVETFGHSCSLEIAITSSNDPDCTKINWKPQQEEESKDLKSQLAQAMAKLEKRQAKAQKANDKLQDAKKEVDRIAAEIEKHYEEIDGVCCSVKVGSYSNNIPECVDVDDPNTWQDGDIVECVEIIYNLAGQWFTVGKQYEYKNCCGIPNIAEDDDGEECGIAEIAKFRFVSRP